MDANLKNKIIKELEKYDIKSFKHIGLFYSNVRSGLSACYGFPCNECIFDYSTVCLLSKISDGLNVSCADVVYCVYSYNTPTYERVDL